MRCSMRAVGKRLRPNSGCNRRWALHAKPFFDPTSGKGGVFERPFDRASLQASDRGSRVRTI
jgi:hypothetical protein